MKPNKEARAALRTQFNETLAACRAARKAGASCPGGDRELTLALAFCNNTPYLAAEANGHEMARVDKPSLYHLAHWLTKAFPGIPAVVLREEYLQRWLADGKLTPKEIFPEEAASEHFTPRMRITAEGATIDQAPSEELLQASR